jgi:hypothetical protein
VDDETGKIRFQALAEKSEKTGQHIIWAESPYLEDAFKDLGREIKRIVYKEELEKSTIQKEKTK